MKVFSGGNLGEVYTRNEIQDMLYDAFGVPKDRVVPSSRDKMSMSFSLQQVNEMEDDEFYWYFTLDPLLVDQDSPKSSFLEASKKMRDIEKKTKVGIVTKTLTYENYLKSVTPKSSFKDFEKKVKEIEND